MSIKKVFLIIFVLLVYGLILGLAVNKYERFKDWEFKRLNAAPVFSNLLIWGLDSIVTNSQTLTIKGFVYHKEIDLYSKNPSSRIVLQITNTGECFALDTLALGAENDRNVDEFKVKPNRYCRVSSTLPLSFLRKNTVYRVLLNYQLDDISLFAATESFFKY